MNIIKFPGLGLEFQISRIAFHIGNIAVYYYALCIVFGIIIGLLLARFSKEKFGIPFDTVLEILIGGIIFGIVGARAYYVIFKMDYFLKNPTRILDIREGGIAIYGAIIAIIIYTIIYCKMKKVNFYNLADYLIPYLSLGQSFGRWGNFFNMEAYGNKTNSILRMGIETATFGYIEVHPVFFYESICTFLIFILLSIVKKRRKFEGQIFCLYFILYGFVRMFLEGLRTDSLRIGNVRVSQLLSFVLFFVFSIFYGIKRRKIRKEEIQK